MSTIPRPQALVDTAVGVFGSLGARELLLHTFHSGTKRIPARATLRLRGFQPRLAGVSLVVGRTPLGVQAAFGVLAFLTGPRWGLGHHRLQKIRQELLQVQAQREAVG